MTACDVAVVGAGPAGATAARHLALAGRSVHLLEAEALPRYKTCGGGLVERARRWIGIDLGDVVEAECHRAEMRFPEADLEFGVDNDRPVVSMTMRSDLDLALAEAAVAAGARLLAPCRVSAVERGRGGRLRLRTERGSLSADYLIAADGAAGRLARLAGWVAEPPRAPALESEIRVSDAALQVHQGKAIFDFGVVPHGYAWIFPKREHLSVGCLSTRRGDRNLRGHLDRYLATVGLETLERQDHGFTIPLAPRSSPLARGRVLLAGDAAGLVDPVTCEGISFAVASGKLAARFLSEHFDEPREAELGYQRALARDVLSELAAARPLARLLYGSPRLTRRIFQAAGDPLCRAMTEILGGRLTYRSLLARPGSYLRLLRGLLRPTATS